MFYSISNCQKGLRGISFGNLLIKQVVAELALELPELQKFVTLSPIPGLTQWLEAQAGDETHGHVAQAVLMQQVGPSDLRAIAAHYLLSGKRDDGQPFDPVARFHLGNGAEIHGIHAEADMTQNGRLQSSGVMVNYLYDLSHTERNHGEFVMNGTITASKAMKALAGGYKDMGSKKESAI